MLDIPCVIFAGGKSSRMGKDKTLLPFGGFDTLTQYQLNKLCNIFKTVYISCKNKDKFDFLKNDEDVNFIEDVKTNNVYAPTPAFIAVFEHLKCDRFFALSVDTPFVDALVINKILNLDAQDVDATVAQTASGIQPLCGVYHRSLEHKFSKMLNDNNHKLNLLLKSSKTTFVEFEDEKKFLNLNHIYEYKEALKLI